MEDWDWLVPCDVAHGLPDFGLWIPPCEDTLRSAGERGRDQLVGFICGFRSPQHPSHVIRQTGIQCTSLRLESDWQPNTDRAGALQGDEKLRPSLQRLRSDALEQIKLNNNIHYRGKIFSYHDIDLRKFCL